MASKENIEQLSKEQKAALKAQRKAEFEAKFQKEKLPKSEIADDKSKAQLKAERRAKQDAQRAAKAPSKTGEQNVKTQSQPQSVPASVPQVQTASAPEKLSPQATKAPSPEAGPKTDATTEKQDTRIVQKELPNKIFSHLPRRVWDLNQISASGIPSIVVQVGYRINKDLIKGSTAKCIAMLIAFKSVIQNHQRSAKKDLKGELNKLLFTDCLKFLSKCRPLSISMNNAIKHLKFVLGSKIPVEYESNDDKIKEILCEAIDVFTEEEVICSWQTIVNFSLKKINEDDIILTLGCSTIVKHVLYNAWKNGKKFRVIVVDTRPKFEGREMLKFLVQNNIPATYILINSISYVMKEVTKVIIEAHSLLANGYVMSHIGSSQVALVAKAYNVPVIVCCETYKFSDRVHTDCFVHNELGDDSNNFFNSIGKKSTIDCSKWPNLEVLDLLYDMTPHEFVSVVITEKGILPCTSVPAILRVRDTK